MGARLSRAVVGSGGLEEDSQYAEVQSRWMGLGPLGVTLCAPPAGRCV